ncbi:MAG: sulfotransferase [Anaerolineaceae bacterium]|nr:sulfotransferase [Anaerolineaceae bacterium]
MAFDLKAFLHYNYVAYFKAKGQHYRLTPKRIAALTIFVLLYIPAEIINWICFGLDEILFPKYRQQQIEKPIFIIGNPRSGTTFLHTLMHKDEGTFTSVTTWEMIFAPSITQRKIIWFFRDIIKLLGIPMKKGLARINKKINFNKNAHKIKINGPEEDEFMLIHIWSSSSLYSIYPLLEETLRHFYFDRDIPAERRKKIMGFYKRIIQRHLFAHGGNKIYLSKNPSFSAKLASLQELFPDARFIDLVRNPFECMPSMMNYMTSGWKVFGDPLEPYPYKEEFFEVMRFYYLYPIEYFKKQDNVCSFITYEELIDQSDEIIYDLYEWLGLEISPHYAEIVEEETRRSKNYKSKHKYSLEEMGITEDQIFKNFESVFEFYEFETREHELPEPSLWRERGWQKNWKNRKLMRRERRLARRLNRRLRRRDSTRSDNPGTIPNKTNIQRSHLV